MVETTLTTKNEGLNKADQEKFSTLPQDQKCRTCHNYLYRSPRCGCGSSGGGSDKNESLDTAGTDTQTLLQKLDADNPDAASIKATILAPVLKPGVRPPSLEEMLKWLTVSMQKDGTIKITAPHHLSPEQKKMVAFLFNKIERLFNHFVDTLNAKKISTHGYKINNATDSLSLTIQIPDKNLRETFIQLLIANQLLHPNHHRQLFPSAAPKETSAEDYAYRSPFDGRKSPLRVTPK